MNTLYTLKRAQRMQCRSCLRALRYYGSKEPYMQPKEPYVHPVYSQQTYRVYITLDRTQCSCCGNVDPTSYIYNPIQRALYAPKRAIDTPIRAVCALL